MGTRLVVVLVALWTLAAPVGAAPAPAQGLQIQLLDAPVSARDNPRAHLYIIDQLVPGAVINRHVRVTNTSPTAASIAVYTAAASVSGGRYLFADGSAQNDLSSWTRLSAGTTALKPGQHIDLTVTIAVPRDTTGGERYAVIWAQRGSGPIAGGAREINRVGVRIYLDVNSSKVAETSDFAITAITGDRGSAGRPRLTAAVRNTGGRTIDVSGAVTLSNGPGGVSVGPVAITTPVTIAPGDTQQIQALFDPQIPVGPWLATVALSSGVVSHSSSATLSFTAAAAAVVATPVLTAPTGSHLGWIMVIGAAIVLAALLVLIGVAIRRRARRPVNN